MSKKQIILLAIMAVADLCVLGLGALVALSGQQAIPVATPLALPVAAFSATFLPAATAKASVPPSATPTPTETHWPTWTPRPSKTPFPSNTPTATDTPTSTDTPTTMPTSTRRPTSTPKPGAGGGTGGTGGGSSGDTSPTLVPGSAECDQPKEGESPAGKLDARIQLTWRGAPDDPSQAIGTLRIWASGGGGCYRYNFFGRNYAHDPIEFKVPKCGGTPTDLIVTSADGQRWKNTFIVSADDPSFKCK